MLEDLIVKNGEMALKFDSLNNFYTVDVEDDVTSLELEYKETGKTKIVVRDNEDLKPGANYVYIDVYEDRGINTYTLLVYKKKVKEVASIGIEAEPLEVEGPPAYSPYIIMLVGAIVILLTYKILFRKRKKQK